MQEPKMSGQDALHDSEERYRNLVDNLAEGVFQMSPEGKYISANSALAVMLGYDSPEDMKASVADRFLFHAPTAVVKEYASLLEEHGFVENYEATLYQKSGSIIWISTSSRAVFNDDGTIHHYEGTVVDITARMAVEKALSESEERYRNLIGIMTEGTWRTSPQGQMLLIGEQLANVMGYGSPEEAIESLSDMGGQLYVDSERRNEFLETLLSSGTVRDFETALWHRNGGIVWVSLTARVIYGPDGEIDYFEGTASDITGRKQVEEELRESEERYRDLVGNLSEGIYQMTPNGKFVSANSALANILGYDSPDELMSQIGDRRDRHVDQSAAKDIIERLEKTGFVKNYEIPLHQKSGSIIWVSINSKTIFDGDGIVTHYEGSAVDITARKAAEEAKDMALLELKKSENQARQLADEAQLLASTLQVAATLESFENALQRCIDIVCEYIGWPVGHLYIPDPSGNGELQPTSIWHLDDPKAFGKFRSVTEQTRFLPGVGLPGRILSSGEPAWITDVQKDSNFPRNQTGDDIKVRGGFGFPVKIGDETVAVLEFFTVESVEPDGGILELMRLIGYQVGQVLERERSRETLKQQAEIFFNVSSILAELDSYEDKLPRIMQELVRITDSDGATLKIPGPQGKHPRLVAQIGSLALATIGSAYSELANSAMESGQPVVVNDYQTNSVAQPWAVSEGINSMVSLPIKGSGQTIAVAAVVSKEINHFNPERVRLLTATVDGLGPLLENARLDGQIRKELEIRRHTETQLLQRTGELEALFSISNILGIPGNYESKLDSILQELGRVAEADWITLRVPDLEEDGLRIAGRAGKDVYSNPFIPTRGQSSISIRAMETRLPVVANDYPSHPGADPSAVAVGARSMITLPILGADEVLGVVAVVSVHHDHFDPERVRLLTAIVDGLGPLLENARLDEQILEELELRRQTESQLLQRSEELEALSKISSILAEPGAYEDKLPSAMQELARVAEATWVTLRIRDPLNISPAAYMISITPDGQDAPAMSARHHGPSASAIEAMKTGEPVVINDYQSYPDALPSNLAEGINSVMSCPIKINEGTFGVISVVSVELTHFTPERVQILTTIAEGLGVFLEKASLDGEISAELEKRRQTEAELLQRSEELEALFSISNILAQPGRLEDKLNQVMEVLLRVSDAFRANLRIPDTQLGVLRIVAEVGNDLESFHTTFPMVKLGGPGIVSNAFDSGEIVVANDYATYSDALPESVKLIQSVITLPITAAGKSLGVVVVVGEETNHFNPERVRVLAGIVDGLGPLLENARLNDEIAFKEDALRQSQKLESVGQLAAGVAHEVNNPLASILGFSKLLLGQEIPDQAKQDVQIIFDEAQRGTTIIQDLLSFARKGTSEKKAIDISGGLNRVLNLKAADFRANHVKVELEIEEDLPEVEADEQQLQQVYLNLLTNAQHAMFDANDGGDIQIYCQRVGDVLRLRFVDDGPGMTKETIKKIFEPFYTTKEEGKGTGLGLSVCYGIIADHGGQLWVESEPGNGATFHIELPCV